MSTIPAPDELLYAMRSGEPQPAEHIAAFVSGVVDGSWSRPQAAAWLAWAFARGLTDDETLALTRSMTHSGHVMRWPEGPTLADKHSTGGVGDKVSLILAPLWAELGLRVPMVSGRGLGHTGGTLDKLESIQGYRTDLDDDELGTVLADVGCFISGQTTSLAPADRILYALRNETCTVESIPLIVASILSKKLAEGVQRLVLDVKTGSGAFMQEQSQARALAEALVRVARSGGADCSAAITAMDRPLGRTIGNALEVEESVRCLRGEGPEDLRACVLALTEQEGAAELLDRGGALERFGRMVEAQGGDRRFIDDPSLLLGGGVEQHLVRAERDGVLDVLDARGIGRAAFVLGAGRRRAEDPVDPGVGIRLHAQLGDDVRAGEPIATVLHRSGAHLEQATAYVRAAIGIETGAPPASPLVLDLIA